MRISSYNSSRGSRENPCWKMKPASSSYFVRGIDLPREACSNKALNTYSKCFMVNGFDMRKVKRGWKVWEDLLARNDTAHQVRSILRALFLRTLWLYNISVLNHFAVLLAV